jgi:hypothetical protein
LFRLTIAIVAKSVILIIVGLVSAVVLAFASYQSESRLVRGVFWVALVTTACVIVYSGIETIRTDRDLQRLKHESGTIRRFDVASAVTLAGDWKSTTPPDFSRYLKTAERGVNIRIEIMTKDAEMRWIEFTDSDPPRIVAGEHNTWILDYTSHAPAGCWIFDVNRDDLQKCGTVVMRLYGIDYNATNDGVVSVNNLTLNFFVNGAPAYRCEYNPSLTLELTPELGSPVRLQLYGPVVMQRVEPPTPVR